jgi:hypothetical protein
MKTRMMEWVMYVVRMGGGDNIKEYFGYLVLKMGEIL